MSDNHQFITITADKVVLDYFINMLEKGKINAIAKSDLNKHQLNDLESLINTFQQKISKMN